METAARAERANRAARPVTIDGDVVRRPSTPATPTVHAFLRHLRAQGLDRVPEPLDDDGRVEALRFVPGARGGA